MPFCWENTRTHSILCASSQRLARFVTAFSLGRASWAKEKNAGIFTRQHASRIRGAHAKAQPVAATPNGRRFRSGFWA